MKLQNTRFVPDLSCNHLLSMLKASEAGMATEFSESGCQIMNGDCKVRACATRHGCLYFFECKYADQANAAITKEDMWQRTLSSHQKARWKYAMEAEMRSLQNNDVWELVELPNDCKPVGSKWVFKVKTNEDGDVERYKARLVAQGFTQVKGTDYDENFCPVVQMESLQTLLAVSAQRGLQLHLDITTAFLNGILEEEVFMRQPEGFVFEGKENLACRLKRSLYGLKQYT